jgi:hypothetical protein
MSIVALRRVQGADLAPGDMIFFGDDPKCPIWYALVIESRSRRYGWCNAHLLERVDHG